MLQFTKRIWCSNMVQRSIVSPITGSLIVIEIDWVHKLNKCNLRWMWFLVLQTCIISCLKWHWNLDLLLCSVEWKQQREVSSHQCCLGAKTGAFKTKIYLVYSRNLHLLPFSHVLYTSQNTERQSGDLLLAALTNGVKSKDFQFV